MYNLAQIAIVLAGILWSIELIPQLRKTIKTKNVKAISLAFFSMCMVAYLLYLFGNYVLENWIIFFSHIPSFLLNLWMVILIIKYRKKQLKDKKIRKKIRAIDKLAGMFVIDNKPKIRKVRGKSKSSVSRKAVHFVAKSTGTDILSTLGISKKKYEKDVKAELSGKKKKKRATKKK